MNCHKNINNFTIFILLKISRSNKATQLENNKSDFALF